PLVRPSTVEERVLRYLVTMKTITFIVLFVVVVAVNSAVDFSSCARMDVPGLSKVAQGLCISSCKYQVDSCYRHLETIAPKQSLSVNLVAV
uniref:Uncharacterized protein n=1 Tax=Parascaris univalens TaxID=6257 RepID=A0A915AFJ6_PARUN